MSTRLIVVEDEYVVVNFLRVVAIFLVVFEDIKILVIVLVEDSLVVIEFIEEFVLIVVKFEY
jgi:hypothetical protein